MAIDEALGGVKAAAVIRPHGAGIVDCLEGFTRILQGQGYVVRGLIQRNGPENPACGCTMMLVDLDTSEHYRISQNLGGGSAQNPAMIVPLGGNTGQHLGHNLNRGHRTRSIRRPQCLNAQGKRSLSHHQCLCR